MRFAKRGLAVAVNYSRSEKEAQETREEVKSHGVAAILCPCNVAVDNAGATRFIDHADPDALTDEVWDQILGVNLKGTFCCCRAALPLLQERQGAIVNVTSIAGLQGEGSSIPYAASKAAGNCLTKSLARAFAPRVRVNAVAPGPVQTRWLADCQDRVERYVQQTPMRQAATPEQVAEVVEFLALSASLVIGLHRPCGAPGTPGGVAICSSATSLTTDCSIVLSCFGRLPLRSGFVILLHELCRH